MKEHGTELSHLPVWDISDASVFLYCSVSQIRFCLFGEHARVRCRVGNKIGPGLLAISPSIAPEDWVGLVWVWEGPPPATMLNSFNAGVMTRSGGSDVAREEWVVWG